MTICPDPEQCVYYFIFYFRNPEVPITAAGLAQLNNSRKEEYLKVKER
jgi:hypothetical protein